MRVSQFMVAIVLALAVSGCMHQQSPQAYYVVDPATGQPVPVVQRYGQAPYAQPQYQYTQQYSAPTGFQQAMPQYAQPSAQVYRQPAAQAQNAQPYGQAYQQPAARPQAAQPRGLFHSRKKNRAQPYATQPYGQQNGVLQYQPPGATQYGYAYAPAQQPYTLDAGDRLRINVFGQQGISGVYLVDAGGNVSLPLIGGVPARGFTTDQLSKMVVERLKQGFVREPHVTVAVEAYRPFFILGEVTTPGQYPYVPNMTAESAVAIAGGFSPRAKKGAVELTRNGGGQRFRGEVPLNYQLRPGDTVVVKERWF